MQLCANGFSANLSLSSTDDCISVNFNAEIDSLRRNTHATYPDDVQLKENGKPSQVRRRRRRRLAKSNIDVQDDVENSHSPSA